MNYRQTRAWVRKLIQSWFSRPRRPLPKPQRLARLQVESLEDRLVPSSWVVTNTSNSAATSGSLPWAVAQANTDTSNADITFNPADFVSATTITLTSPLTLSNPSFAITIDGSGAGPITVSGGGTVQDFVVDTTVTIENLTISLGQASEGAGINNSGTLTVSNCTISDCSASEQGGALYTTGPTVVQTSTISGNSGAPLGGPGIDVVGTTLAIINSTLSGNTSTDDGLGTAICSSAQTSLPAVVTILGCNISGNSTSYGYGAVYNSSGTMTIINSTITDNQSALSVGGGVCNGSDGNGNGILNVLNTTITGNSATGFGGGGGGISNGPSCTLNLANCVIAGNSGSPGPDIDNIAGVVNANYTLVGNSSGSGISGGTGNILNPTSADLGTLSNNGGPTETVPLLTGSPAIGAAGAVTQLAAAIPNTTATSLTVANGNFFAAASLPTLATGSYFTIQIDAEQMAVTAVTVSGTTCTFTVTRAANGTTAATHAANAAVFLVSDQRGDELAYADPAVVDMGAYQGTASAGSQPTVTAVNPNTGPATGGTSVVITGTNFTGATVVDFGTTAAASFVVNSATQITAVDPAEAAGTVDVTVTTSSGTSATSASDLFTYTTGLVVMNTSNSPAVANSLPWCVALANTYTSNADITFDPADFPSATTITLANTLTLSNTSFSITIDGTGVGPVTISGGGTVQPFVVNSNVTATMTDLTISNGSGDTGGAIHLQGTLTLNGCTISNNSADAGGGGIWVGNAGNLTMQSNSVIEGNTCAYTGGGIYLTGPAGTAAITDSSVENNVNDGDGGAIWTGGSLTITNSTISNNTASSGGHGGGIFVDEGSLTLNNSTVGGNSASADGGGIYLNNDATLTVSNGSTIENNIAGATGGGISVNQNDDSASISDSTITQNSTSADGGGIYNNGSLTLLTTTISDNTAAGNSGGGGLINNGGTVTASTCIFSGNTASANNGGGIWNGGFGSDSLTLTTCTISDNSSMLSGGGIYLSSGTVTVQTSTGIEGNTSGSGGSGGGIDVNGGTLTVLNSIITDNSAAATGQNSGAGFNISSGTVVVSTCTISDNTATGDGGGFDVAGGGTLTISDSSLTGNSATSGNGGGLFNAGTAVLYDSALTGNVATTAGSGFGGAFYNQGGGTLTVVDCDITGNSAFTQGAALATQNSGNTVNILNCTIAGNTGTNALDLAQGAVVYIDDSTIADNSAPGIDLTGSLTLQLLNCTITGNSTSGSGGGINNAGGGGHVELINTIVAGNTATTADPDIDGSIFGGIDSLIGDGTGMTGGLTNGTNGNLVGTAASPINADLGSLANNGGPNEPSNPPDTIALLAGSPALGTGGNCTSSLSAAITNTATSFDITNNVFAASSLPSFPTGYFIIQIDSEQMLVTAYTTNGSTTTLTVTRNVNGTLPAAHAANASIFLVSDERGDVPTFSAAAVVNMGALQNAAAAGSSPTVVSVTPNTGSTSGGTTVVILGTNFTGATSVMFGATAATSFTVNSATQITAVDPAEAAGTVDVTVTTSAGTSATSASDQFTYAGLVVTNASNSAATVGSLPWCVAQADSYTSNADITFDPADFTSATTITLAATLDLTNASFSITIDGSGAGPISVSGGGSVTVFDIASGNTAVIRNLTVTDGVASVQAGGIVNAGTLTLLDDTVSDCMETSAGFGGEGAGIWNTGVLTVINSAFTGNSSAVDGGAIGSTAGSVTLLNCTISGNTANGPAGGGAGIYNNFTSVLIICATTISGNIVNGGGNGAGIDNGGTFSLVDDIVAGNNASTAPDISGTATAGNNNIIGDGSGMAGLTNGTNGNQVGTAASPINPLLGALANNGGPTQTMLPQSGSPAFNNGGAVTQLNAAVTAAATSITVADAYVFASASLSTLTSGSYFTIQIDAEQMTVTGVTVNAGGTATLTVVRAADATTAAAHASSAALFLVSDQRGDLAPYNSAAVVNIGAVQNATAGASPTVTLVSPNSGPTAGGTSVVITGTNFTGATAVKFGATAATSFVVNSSTQITAVDPAEAAGTVNVTVTTSAGTSAVSASDDFTYTAAASPTVTAVNPNSGPTAGGTTVVITGTNFTGATAVKFGATAATSFVVNSSTQITAVDPAEAAGTVNVTVTTAAGTSAVSASDDFTYTAATSPTVTSVNPNSGPTAGGTAVVITGTNFTGATTVMFGAVTAASFTVNSSTQITAVDPAEAAGVVNVTVTTPSGTSVTSASDEFTYGVTTLTTVTSVNPRSGSGAGGMTVVITGTNFVGVTQVDFGSTPASSFTVTSTTHITAIDPAEAAGTVNVTVTDSYGTSATSTADQFTYLASTLPTVTAVNPNTGPVAGGTSVVITGTNFTGATAVKFGSTAATSFTVNSTTQITAVAPAEAAGTVDVTVTNATGTSATSASDDYTYAASTVPTVTAVSPNTGPVAGGTTVVITGTNFTGATAVKFGSTAATSFTVNSATQITAVDPAEAAGTVNVTVTTASGTSAASSSDYFSYGASSIPTVTSLSPRSGSGAGGASVVITGTNFTGVTSVMFGSTAATSFTVNSSTHITAIDPAEPSGVVNVTVTTAAGTSATSASDDFTYVAAPAVTGLSAVAGSSTGGTNVVISGTNFAGATAVTFGGTPALNFLVSSDSQIDAVAPAEAAGATVDVEVTTANGTSPATSADQFVFVAAPVVSTLSPSFGPLAGGTSVVITGANFTGATAVMFGSTAASSFTVNSATQITAIAPAEAAGTVNVTVTTAGGTSASSSGDAFIFDTAPVLAAIGSQTVLFSQSATTTLNATVSYGTLTLAAQAGGYSVAYGTEQQYSLANPGNNYSFNDRGQQEEYLISTNGSNAAHGGYFVLMPNGNLYAWDGNSLTTTIASGAVAVLGTSVYANPTLLFTASGPISSTAFSAEQKLDLQAPAGSNNFYFNDRGGQEEYLVSGNGSNAAHSGYYVLMPNGNLYAWNGNTLATTLQTAVVATLPTAYYQVPSLLYTAGPAGVSATVSGNTLTVSDSSGYLGTVTVLVSASDGLLTSTQSFQVAFTDSGLVLTQPANQSTTASQPASVALITSGTASTYSAQVGSYSVAYGAEQQLALGNPGNNYFYNDRGQQEEYLISNNGSNAAHSGYYVLMPNGNLYAWDGNSVTTSISAPAVAALGTSVYANPALLNSAPLPFSSAAYASQQKLDLQAPAGSNNYFFNDRGDQEEYLVSGNGSNPAGSGFYVLMPSGNLYAWNGSSIATTLQTSVVATLPTVFYENPSLLYSAGPAGVSATVAVVAGTPTVTVSGNGYLGTVTVIVSASDGAMTSTQSFQVTFTDTLTLAQLTNQSVAQNQTATVPLSVTAGTASTYTAQVGNVSLAFAIEQQLALGNPGSNYYFNDRGDQEEYLVSSNGSNSAHSGYYVLMPNGNLYVWDGNSVITSIAAGAVAALGTSVYANPTLLNSAALPYSAASFTSEQKLDLQAPSGSNNYFYNDRGDQEEYLVSGNGNNSAGSGYYVLMPSGNLYAWNGSSIATTLQTSVVATLPTVFYQNPSLLYSAGPAGVSATVTVVSGVPTVSVSDSSGYLGTVTIIVSASDGVSTSTQSFQVTFTDTLTLAQPTNPAAVSNAQSASVTLNVTSGTASTFTAQVGNYSATFAAEQQLGLANPGNNYYFNDRGQQEEYLISTNGSNAAHGGYYVLMPNGDLYTWNGSSVAGSIAGGAVAVLGTSVYANPALLSSASSPYSAAAYVAEQKLDLQAPAGSSNYYLNDRGDQEEYLVSGNGSNAAHSGYYVLMPNGNLYAWNGSSLATTLQSSLVATLPTVFYQNPSLLYSAAPVGVSANISFVTSATPAAITTNTVVAGGTPTVTVTDTSGFVGTVTIIVSAGDGATTSTQSFQVTFD